MANHSIRNLTESNDRLRAEIDRLRSELKRLYEKHGEQQTADVLAGKTK